MADDQARRGLPIPRSPHFLASYSADSSSERLKIPDRFITHIQGRLSGLVSLLGPSGSEWSVELFQQNGALFFHHGWPAFLRDHSVDCGDFLVFRYDGELHFTVQVFDQSGCEKEAAFHSRCSDLNKYVERKRGREEAASSGNQLVEGVAKKRRDRLSPLHSECVGLNCELMRGSNNEEGRRHEGVVCEEATSSKETKPHEGCGHDGVMCEEAACSKETKPLENTCLDIVEFNTKASVENMGEEDELSVNAEAYMQVSSAHKVHQSFSSLNPSFVRIMKSFNVSGSYTLNIPSTFSVAYLPNCKVKIILQNLKGESWKVNSVPNTRETGHTLCGGWMAFVCDNDIKLGDICIFELVDMCEFRVHIRSAPMSSCLSAELATSLETLEGLPKNMKGSSPKVHSKTTRVTFADKIASRKYREAASTNGTRKHRCTSKSLTKVAFSQSKTASEKLETDNRCKKVVEDELDRQDGRGSSLRSTIHEEKSARSFTSCFPNFVKIMRKFNVTGSYTLNIPYQFSKDHLPKYKTEIMLRNSEGKCWIVNCLPASKEGKVHTFCGGWTTFVRGNDVNIGDICTFELVGKHEMRVYISRVGKRV